jgi:hypothetical protein
MRIVARRVRCEAAGRAVFEALVDRQDQQLAGAAEFPVGQYPRQISFCARIVAFISGENFFNFLTDTHIPIPLETGPPEYSIMVGISINGLAVSGGIPWVFTVPAGLDSAHRICGPARLTRV